MLGTFGDSYADPNSPSNSKPWMDFLAEKLDMPVENHGRSGTSIWWSYEKFLKNYQKFSHIVFTYSHFNRMNHLPAQFEGMHFKTPMDPIPNDLDKKALLQESVIRNLAQTYFKYFYDENLQLFLYQKIYEEVDLLCKKNDIEVIHNFAFEPCKFDNVFYIKFLNTRNVYGSDKIGAEETNAWKPGSLHTGDFGVEDRRVCHFTEKNNKIFAEILFQLYNDDVKNLQLEKSMFDFSRSELEKYFYK